MLENNNKMVNEITVLVNEVKNKLSREINNSILYVYWNIGRIIVSNENEYNNRLEYGKEVLKGLSKELTKYLGKGYSYTNLKYMRIFYINKIALRLFKYISRTKYRFCIFLLSRHFKFLFRIVLFYINFI